MAIAKCNSSPAGRIGLKVNYWHACALGGGVCKPTGSARPCIPPFAKKLPLLRRWASLKEFEASGTRC